MVFKGRQEDYNVFRVHEASCNITVVKIVPMARWYVADAFFSQKDMRVNAYVLTLVVKVILSRSFRATRICQYSEFASRVLKIFASPRLSMRLCILRIEYALRAVMALGRMLSTQKRRVPFSFGANTTGAAKSV